MPASLPPNSIFLCYRRLDSEEMVDRIYLTFAEKFGRAAVFRDIDTIPDGVDFAEYIQQSLRKCAVVLVFIGRDFATTEDKAGRRRLDDPDDHVRIEIETALSLENVRVIPVLVRRAEMPEREMLPESLHPLRRLNARTVRSSGADYQHDFERLCAVLSAIVVEAAQEKRKREEESRKVEKKRDPASDEEPKVDSAKPSIGALLLRLCLIVAGIWLVGKMVGLLPADFLNRSKVQEALRQTPRPSTPPISSKDAEKLTASIREMRDEAFAKFRAGQNAEAVRTANTAIGFCDAAMRDAPADQRPALQQLRESLESIKSDVWKALAQPTKPATPMPKLGVTATLSKPFAVAGETITFHVELKWVRERGKVPEFSVDGLEIKRLGFSTAGVEGVKMSVTYNYDITPIRAGNFTIPSIEVMVEGERFRTEPLTLTVKPD